MAAIFLGFNVLTDTFGKSNISTKGEINKLGISNRQILPFLLWKCDVTITTSESHTVNYKRS